ncbi:hypothetical protein LMG28138_04689 [Pararobbsia alpina]|uniref:Uncharacterized protein n=1 Tax=Pararobbsia alpina TaxID=621374 RepID=A0A6S7C276_9BURK|nr:hypothetical protein [Pararobbsia alpina]CAB3799622.1 hypothetical protein LMG28138_04689 [Pararobbsia alpina]
MRTQYTCVVFRLATRAKGYPDTLGYGPQFEAVVRAWRPELLIEYGSSRCRVSFDVAQVSAAAKAGGGRQTPRVAIGFALLPA